MKERYETRTNIKFLVIMIVMSFIIFSFGLFTYLWVGSIIGLLSGTLLALLVCVLAFWNEYISKPATIVIDEEAVDLNYRTGRRVTVQWEQIEATRIPSSNSKEKMRMPDATLKLVNKAVWIPVSFEAAKAIKDEYEKTTGRSLIVYDMPKAWLIEAFERR